jgi:CRISPR-associated protein Cmr4
MAQFKTYCYEIRLLTNMHVGSGDTNYGIIDKLVQRDLVTGNPSVHASSLKGALREFFTKEKGRDEKKDSFILHVFGSDPKEKDNLKNGEYRFLTADLFLLPVRSSHQQYYLATNRDIAKNFIDKLDLLDIKDGDVNNLPQKLIALSKIEESKNPIIFSGVANTMLEDYSVDLTKTIEPEVAALNTNYDNKLALFGDNFKELAQNLPVIARNQLDNGKSENLWYEEIVPHQSRFITFISIPDNAESNEYFKTFDKELTSSLIQLGANGSIGYGLCKFTKLNAEEV